LPFTQHVPAFFLVAGIAVFALAMRWDISDRDRATRRSGIRRGKPWCGFCQAGCGPFCR
jgi:hypothetical protein